LIVDKINSITELESLLRRLLKPGVTTAQ
jgi:hypothetical protein